MLLIHFVMSVGLRYPLSSSILPGNVNFDPLGLSSLDLTPQRFLASSPRDPMDILNYYAEAEIKHARLAMLGAVAYPIQETLNPIIAEKFDLPSTLAPNYLSPSLLNGNLEASILIYFIGIGSALELSRMFTKNETTNNEYVAGDYKWRFTLAKENSAEFYALREGEIWNGRLAMIAMLGYVVQETLTQTPVLKALA